MPASASSGYNFEPGISIRNKRYRRTDSDPNELFPGLLKTARKSLQIQFCEFLAISLADQHAVSR